jgi:ankyrin repeat protein
MATKTTVKSLFLAIRHGSYSEVTRLIENNPELINSRRSAPPKKDDGQSPLQVACKTGHFAIAEYFLDRGANVNYIEESSVNEWRAPVLHAAIRAAVFNMPSRFSVDDGSFDLAIKLIRRMLELGADPKGIDSYGNNCLIRLALDLRMRLRSGGIDDRSDAPSHPQFDERAKALLGLLIKAGADPQASNATRESVVELVRGSYLARFFPKNAA